MKLIYKVCSKINRRYQSERRTKLGRQKGNIKVVSAPPNNVLHINGRNLWVVLYGTFYLAGGDSQTPTNQSLFRCPQCAKRPALSVLSELAAATGLKSGEMEKLGEISEARNIKRKADKLMDSHLIYFQQFYCSSVLEVSVTFSTQIVNIELCQIQLLNKQFGFIYHQVTANAMEYDLHTELAFREAVLYRTLYGYARTN